MKRRRQRRTSKTRLRRRWHLKQRRYPLVTVVEALASTNRTGFRFAKSPKAKVLRKIRTEDTRPYWMKSKTRFVSSTLVTEIRTQIPVSLDPSRMGSWSRMACRDFLWKRRKRPRRDRMAKIGLLHVRNASSYSKAEQPFACISSLFTKTSRPSNVKHAAKSLSCQENLGDI